MRFAYIMFFLVLATLAQAQVIQPARLTAETPTQTIKVGDEVELIFKASIDKGWYIYSVGFDADCGPFPMGVTLEKHPSFTLAGSFLSGMVHCFPLFFR